MSGGKMKMRRTVWGTIASLLVIGAVGATPAAGAEKELNATANGRAEAAAVFLPFRVNPNIDFYPAYSYSEIANAASQSTSHGISAGFYPGFLLDAFMDFYGFKGPGRALLGFAETQWPDPPQEATASTADFGKLCKESGSNPQITQYFPKQLFDGCQQFYSAFTGGFGGSLPYRLSSGHSRSDFLTSSGFSDGFELTLPLPGELTIGHAHSTSQTSAASKHASVSDATAVLQDVAFGALHISQVRSSASATNDARLGPKTTRKVEIVGATIAGRSIIIDSNGVRPVTDNEQTRTALERFAQDGFDVRLIQGNDSVDPDSGEVSTVSGGLSIRMVRSGTPAELKAPSDELCAQTSELQQNPALTPGSVHTFGYDLSSVPPLNDAYHNAWDKNYPLGLVLPRDLEGEEPLPPVIPCAGVLFDRAVDAGVVLAVTAASARFTEGVPLPDLGDVVTPGIPDRVITTTITLPGTGTVSAPPAIVPGPAPALVASGPEFGADVANRIRLLYGAMVLVLAALVAGRTAFRRLIRT
jgi:hypothetical protein